MLYRLPTGGTLPAPIFDIINRALANTKVGPGEVEDINTHPSGLPGGKYSMELTALHNVPPPNGPQPYCHGRNLGGYQKVRT